MAYSFINYKDPETGENKTAFNTNYVDSRFGKLAYSSPVTSWPTIPKVAQRYGLKVEKGDNNTYQFFYPRTNRALAGVTGVFAAGRNDRINPRAADTILDFKDYLDRTDPNYYRYNLQDKSRNSDTTSALIQALTNLSTGREGLQQPTPVGGGLTQWENPTVTAIARMLGAKS